jgi:hypothetical protein
MKSTLTVIALFFVSSSAYAQDGEQEVKYKAKTEIDFEGLEVEGELIKPQGALLRERSSAAFNPLIKLRTDFKPEMNQSVNEIK